MKLLDFSLAPNPKKVRVYLREKGLDIPIEQVDVMGGKNRTPEFLGKVNPLGGLPVLELDDGTHLTESLAIMEYLEDLHPNPPMLGGTAMERARVRETERICDLGVLLSIGTYFQNTSPFFAGRVSLEICSTFCSSVSRGISRSARCSGVRSVFIHGRFGGDCAATPRAKL